MADRAANADDFSTDDSESARVFAKGLAFGSSVDAALDRLLAVTGSRATGLWRATDESLTLVAFRAVSDMPANVREEFRQITSQLPLAKTELGVVKAAATGQPVPAYLEVNAGELSGSATWLKRFACRQSLALPIDVGETLYGVIAISTPEEFTAESRTWRYMVALAQAIAFRCASAPSGGTAI